MNELPLPSNRSFGALFVVMFALAGAHGWWRGGPSYVWWLALSGVTLLVTLCKPDLLAPLNRAWMRVAELLNKIASPILLGFMFYGVFTPTGIAMRLAGRDPMTRHFDPHARTYWRERTPPGPDPSGLPNQF
jgi:hypothetical protein